MNDLEKSHSRLSNFNLSLIIIFTLIAVSAFWFALAILNIDRRLSIIILIASLISTMVGLILINKFKR